MILFKAAGNTYRRVVTQALHAFPYSPVEVRVGEFVLLSKNREDCRPTEPQIQFAAKLLSVRPATPEELEKRFPNVDAATRWGFLATLYWSRPFDRPFNLSQVRGLNAKRYDTVQEFARFDEPDESLLFDFLCKSNPRVIMDFVSNAEPPESNR